MQSGKIYHEQNKDIPEKIRLFPGDSLFFSSGNYTVKDMIGKGGFAHIYSINSQENKTYALKVLDLWLVRPNEYEFMECKFRQEFETGKIPSPFLVQSYFSGHLEGNPYIIMDYCPNNTLDKRLDEFRNESQITYLAIRILKGLSDLHKKGVIHRDLKPENIIFDEKDEAKLSDFGIAGHLNRRLTSRNFIGMVSQVWGTPLYSSPEQLSHIKAFKLTAPTMDIFSFGVIMYELLSRGKHPFGDPKILMENPSKYINNVQKKNLRSIDQVAPGISGEWRMIINKCLEFKAQNRFQNVEEILSMLEKINSTAKKKYVFRNAFTEFGDNGLIKKLRVIEGEEFGRVYELNENINELTIGRLDPEGVVKNNIALKETRSRFVSRRHATIKHKSGVWYLRDGQKDSSGESNELWRGSLNGTFINYESIPEGTDIKLKEGDVISIGDVMLRFQKEEALS